MLFCLGKIGYTLLQYRKGADTYESIRTVVTAPAGEKSEAAEEPDIDFAALQNLYPDAVAWLRCEERSLTTP